MAQGYQHFQPPHSDFLIHWTGKDIDKEIANLAETGANADSSVTCEDTTKKYIERLKSLLDYGLWMTEPDDKDEGSRPRVPRTCFTELKISEVRSHAARYGRLGIGFKRPFVMERGGLPVWYYPQSQGWKNNWIRSLGRANLEFSNKDLYACFLKPMGNGEGMERYNFLYESEWRIIFADWLEHESLAIKPTDVEGFPYKEDKRLRYLLPVKSRWLAMIIYPSIQALHAAQKDESLRYRLRKIKSKESPSGRPLATAGYEGSVLPIELNLDSCRNF